MKQIPIVIVKYIRRPGGQIVITASCDPEHLQALEGVVLGGDAAITSPTAVTQSLTQEMAEALREMGRTGSTAAPRPFTQITQKLVEAHETVYRPKGKDEPGEPPNSGNNVIPPPAPAPYCHVCGMVTDPSTLEPDPEYSGEEICAICRDARDNPPPQPQFERRGARGEAYMDPAPEVPKKEPVVGDEPLKMNIPSSPVCVKCGTIGHWVDPDDHALGVFCEGCERTNTLSGQTEMD